MLTEDEKDALFEAICDGDRDCVVALVTKARDAGDDLAVLLNEAMIPAMAEVGEQFSAGEVFVPEMLVAARAMQGGIDIIEPVLAQTDHEPLARVCIGSVKGDWHDIGKNLVVMMLKGAGFEVEDLGVDVANEEFAKALERGNQVVCLSALLTTTKPQMISVVNHLREVSNGAKIVIGGAVITQDYADKIGADAFGEDAPGAVKAVKRALGMVA
ncbi:cobalamin-dependent protein [Ruegeria marina]|uniref:5-methyltetrahydrofolate--homocysteine methyltransferase n=1 Tax=Ruegeria marina TaxID=639004 RepID=A0A1G6I2D1_9RHOB|nr:cobalamin-dependent protein [Ruegeria marina]SDC00697.1 5-methyltetrahydrofolate--homocysteine methyltransferase [Ruegeria marina]